MRKTAAHAFYLAVFALLTGDCTVTAASSEPSQSHSSPEVCAFEPKAKVSDACASYADLDTLNGKLQPYVRNLASNTDFFSYYRLNLYDKGCPFWNDDEGLCGNIACAVTTLENEEDIPAIWRAEELSKLEGPKAQHPGRKQQKERQRPLLDQLGKGVGESCVVEYDDECDDRDYCVPDDESASAKGDYVSLVNNPERFTGYAGEAAHRIWEAIYRENCFSKPVSGDGSVTVSRLSAPAPPGFQNQAQAALDFKQVMRNHDRKEAMKLGVPDEALEFEDECLEKRVFYRVISGMHAAISTHLCHDYLNQTTGEWGPNLQCYKDRLHDRPERISNLYFNYAFLLRAVGKLRDYVQDYTFCTGDPVQDKQTKEMITRLSAVIPSGPQIFDESVMFQDDALSSNIEGLSLKEDFRNRFRNVSRIMDCVGCDKCRLWGKVQTNGFGTALKVLFEIGNGDEGEEKVVLRRTEMVALINTLDKVSTALKALEDFRIMIAAEIDGKDPQLSYQVAAEQQTSAQQSPAEASNFDDLEELDDFPDLSPPSDRRKAPSISEAFWSELDLIWRAYKYVLWSWSQLPRTLGTVAATEVSRLWDFWLGRPIRPRTWEIRLPKREDLFREGREEL
ncbi:hypothetical protein B0A50_07379 [Salinomyces thailandicus]|uniref:Endoplasmic oxidoreductin-1 n=1 Tax=Salinomyces thailandicus TaxID=706561 RepID=A0A4U0TMT7_9PEZI|nr:hypothetical protein B0A50_07379 [Salinomyces thailandica]